MTAQYIQHIHSHVPSAYEPYLHSKSTFVPFSTQRERGRSSVSEQLRNLSIDERASGIVLREFDGFGRVDPYVCPVDGDGLAGFG